jgi:hypothetical protein
MDLRLRIYVHSLWAAGWGGRVSYGGNDRVYTCLKVRSAGGMIQKSIVNYVRR